MKDFWNKISRNGISENIAFSEQETKRMIFFNQVLFIGIIATLFQVPTVWPFIGVKSLFFLGVCLVLLLCFLLNKRGKFLLSKGVYVICIFGFGTYTTTLLGGAALYHIQSILIFFSCLILLDYKKDRLLILAGIPFMLMSIFIGEFNWFNAPDFSDHPLTEVLRISNILSIIVISTIFIYFIIRLNKTSEEALSKVLKEVTNNAKNLEKGKLELESIVQERTSEISKQRDVLKLQNEEKIVLLKEVHHRVRNNLQIIISLINLQLSGIVEEKTINALREIQGRVDSMSLVHQKMYQTSNFKEINLNSYTRQIIDNLCKLYDNKQVTYSVNIAPKFCLKMDEAIPVGLIINEIVSNFFKHGYQNEENHFSITTEINDADLQLIYQDNGVGFDQNIVPDELNSLGLQLILNLTEQLDGTCDFKNNKGACYIIQLPI